LRRLLQTLLLAGFWAFVAVGGAAAQTPPVMRVSVIGSDFVLSAKYERLAGFASPQGVAVRGWSLSALPEAAVWDDADLVLLDTPRPADVEAVEAHVGEALRARSGPWVRIGGGPPAFGGLTPETGRRIAAYYAAGGRQNFTALFAYLKQWKTGDDLSAPPPSPLGAVGYYYPAASSFAAGALPAWLSARPERPRAAILIGASTVADDDTAVVDALIAALDAKGIDGVAVWFDQRAPRGLIEAVKPLNPDLLINTQHIVAGGVIRDQLIELDVPAVMTFSYREGDADAWRRASAGLNSRSAAALLAPAETWGMNDPMIVSAVDHGALVPIPEQIEAVAARAVRQIALRRTPNGQKRLALMFWNHPGGEANISASNLNVPRSLEAPEHRPERCRIRHSGPVRSPLDRGGARHAGRLLQA